MPVTLSVGTLTDVDLWQLKQALAAAQPPAAPGNPTPPVPPSPPAGGRILNIALDWGAPRSGNVVRYTKDFGGFRGSDLVVVKFTTPPTESADQIGTIQAAEFQSNAVARTASLSLRPGSFDNELAAKGPFGLYSGPSLVTANTVSLTFQIGGSSAWHPVLQPNTTYYVNIKNASAVGGDMKIELIKPPGL